MARRRRKKRMGAISTTETLLIVGGAVVVGYMLLKPKTPTVPTTVYVPVNTGSSNQTAQDISAAGGALSSIFNGLFN